MCVRYELKNTYLLYWDTKKKGNKRDTVLVDLFIYFHQFFTVVLFTVQGATVVIRAF